MRIAVVIKERCNPLKCDHLCSRICPVNRAGKECITINDKALIDESLCTGCGLCVKKCPFNAIIVVNLPEQLDEQPFYRYGVNEFVLYRVPEPEKGKVLGLIGQNGIGKTTALKLLSGLLKPNLGLEKITEPEILKHLRGTKAQTFFTELFRKELRTVYKPQRVELIRTNFKGTVREFLKKAGNSHNLLEVCTKLNIESLLNRELTTLSGGELQKVAIAFTSLKNADFRFIDEPSSYLDIKQRVKIAGFIKELSENSSIVVVEHDLLMLDYTADYVQVMFGVPNAYGIVSKPMQAKTGINAYLQGFLKDLNIRFREKPINFKLPQQRIGVSNELALWPRFTVNLQHFQLKAMQGNILENEIIGIIGENSIGKSTFIKALAGVLKTQPEINLNLNIAYKPQYLELEDPNITVREFLSGWKDYKHLLKAFNIEPLLDQELSTLSGGELQKTFIARALTRKANIVLLDEPSAYLDIEQRLQLGKIVRDLITATDSSAIIVDHDLLFLTQVSNRLIVFNGDPGIRGIASNPKHITKAMNEFLKSLQITVRKDPVTHRPRINKPESLLDREQKQKGDYYNEGDYNKKI